MSASVLTLPRATGKSSHDNGWWAMACFCGTEAAFFAYLITAYYYLAMRSPTWPPPGIHDPELLVPCIMTVLLLSSSATTAWGERGAREGDTRQLVAGLGSTMVIGCTFIALFVYEYREKLREMLPQTHAYASLYYVITGVHALHVMFGIVLLAYTLTRALRSPVELRGRMVATSALYWHFVGVVWLAIMGTVYLSPRFT